MAKRRSKKGLSKEAQIAIAIGFVLAIFLFGGQLTGMATSHNTDLDITISEVASCTIASAPTSVSATGGTAGTYQPAGDGTITNDGNKELILKVASNVTAVNGLFSDGSTVTFDGISGTGTVGSDITAITSTAQSWCTGVGNGESCTWDFDVITTAAEAAATYEFTYTITCV